MQEPSLSHNQDSRPCNTGRLGHLRWPAEARRSEDSRALLVNAGFGSGAE